MDNKEKEFERMVQKHKDTVYTVCYMFSKDEDEVADLFQETLINMWKGMAGTDLTGNQKGWIYRVAFNTCISNDRKRRRHPTARLTMDVNLFDAEEERSRHADALHKRISRLQPFDRAIVLLWLEDISYEEIGQILGISTKNVSVRLVRIREQLKNMSNL